MSKVINIDEIKGRVTTIPGTIRTLKDVLVTENTTTHLGIIPPGQVTSRHNHPNSEELVYVVQGKGNVTIGKEEKPEDETMDYSQNFLVYIPKRLYHQYRNLGDGNLILFVVYSPPGEVPKK